MINNPAAPSYFNGHTKAEHDAYRYAGCLSCCCACPQAYTLGPQPFSLFVLPFLDKHQIIRHFENATIGGLGSEQGWGGIQDPPATTHLPVLQPQLSFWVDLEPRHSFAHTHTHTRMHTHTHTRTHTHTHARTHARTHAHTRTHTHARTHKVSARLHSICGALVGCR